MRRYQPAPPRRRDLKSLEILLSRSENLAALPQVVGTALRMLDNLEGASRDVARLVERDPAMAGKIMRVANSAYYGGRDIQTVQRAVNFLGLKVLRSLIVSLTYQQMTLGRAGNSRLDKLEHWRHSLATAIAARLIARFRMPFRAEDVYLAGLLHDVGILVLDRFMPEELGLALESAASRLVPLHEAERDVFGFDHAAVGGILAEQWGLGPLLRNAILFHHHPEDDGEYYETTVAVAIGDWVAHKIGLRNNQLCDPGPLDPQRLIPVGVSPEDLDTIERIVTLEVIDAERAFQITRY